MQTVETINRIVMLLFFICYSYQFFYVAVSLLRRPKAAPETEPKHRLAVLIAARNEQAVLGALLDSIAAQTYPTELLDVFVCADNCTDETAAVARTRRAGIRAPQPRPHGQGLRAGLSSEKHTGTRPCGL